MRSSTSVAANYRAACRARSSKEYISKLGIVIEEADETLFWFEILTESKLIETRKAEHLIKEMNELLSIFIKSRQTLKEKLKK